MGLGCVAECSPAVLAVSVFACCHRSPPIPCMQDWWPAQASRAWCSETLRCHVLRDLTLPPGAGAHMFGRPGLRLPHLQELCLIGVEKLDGYSVGYLTAADVASIVGCCEGGSLRELTLRGVVKQAVGSDQQPNYHGYLKTALTTLTYLSVSARKQGWRC